MTVPMPVLQYIPAPCPVCRAATEDEAANRCKLRSDETGERYCQGDCEANKYGVFVRPTAESLARMDAWYEAEAANPSPTEGDR